MVYYFKIECNFKISNLWLLRKATCTLCECPWRNRNLEYYYLMSLDLRCCFGSTEGVQEGRLGASCFDLSLYGYNSARALIEC